MAEVVLQTLWVNPQQAQLSVRNTIAPWCSPHLRAGRRLAVQIRLAEDVKTDLQRNYYHGVILKEIAMKARPNGQQFPLAVWKEHFRKEYLGFKTVTCIDPMTGKKSRRRVRVSTEDLGIRAYSDLIDRVTAYACSELGVEFSVRTFAEYEGMQVDPDTGEILG